MTSAVSPEEYEWYFRQMRAERERWWANPWAFWPPPRLSMAPEQMRAEWHRSFDREWEARWPHERVEQDGYEVPLYAPEPERAAWLTDPRAVLRGRRWRILRRR